MHRNRRHIVLTRDAAWSAPGAEVAGDVAEALMLAGSEAQKAEFLPLVASGELIGTVPVAGRASPVRSSMASPTVSEYDGAIAWTFGSLQAPRELELAVPVVRFGARLRRPTGL